MPDAEPNFAREWGVLRALEKRLETMAPDGTVSRKEYAEVLHHYQMTFRKMRRLVKVSDRTQSQLNRAYHELEVRQAFIEKAFGQYVPDQVVAEILNSPEGASIGGERRVVTILMADLRGFSAMSEALSAETTVDLLGRYFEAMTQCIQQHGGTIIEFLGDSILAVFGAPLRQVDDAAQAVASAVAMQQAMPNINARNARDGWPELSMGIGVHTGEVVVGNLGSPERAKYGLVGSAVNLTSRIESYTSGGQIFISEACQQACGGIVEVEESFEVAPKGASQPIVVHAVRGIGGRFDLHLDGHTRDLRPFNLQQAVWVQLVSGKHNTRANESGRLLSYGGKIAELDIDEYSVDRFANLKLVLQAPLTSELAEEMYAKVYHVKPEGSCLIRFTSLPEALARHFDELAVTAQVAPDFSAHFQLDW